MLQENLKKYDDNYVEQSILSQIKTDIGKKNIEMLEKYQLELVKDMMTNRTKKKELL